MGCLQNCFDMRSSSHQDMTYEQLPNKKKKFAVKNTDILDIEVLQEDLTTKSQLHPEEYLSDLEVEIDDANENTIIISGYAPNNDFDIEVIFLEVLRHDSGATLHEEWLQGDVHEPLGVENCFTTSKCI